MAKQLCITPSCQEEAKLQCPTCIKLNIQGSFFCSQECFTKQWSDHKIIHKSHKPAKPEKSLSNLLNGDIVTNYNIWPGHRFTGKLRPAPQSSRRTVPDTIGKPDYAESIEGTPLSEIELRGTSSIKVLTDEEIEGVRVAGKLGREVLDEASKVIGVGVTTDEVDRIVHEACVDRECYPSPLNYYRFPKSCCTSVNEVICHGIPDMRSLNDGDICNVDVTVYHRGFHGDLNETFCLGNVSTGAEKLVKTTWECLQKSIEMVKPGVKYRDVGNTIQKHAQTHAFSVVRSYCGHGIHRLFHTTPSIPHYSKNKAVGIMKPGHCFTIEPMISEGNWRDETWPDDWTAVTQDGKYQCPCTCVSVPCNYKAPTHKYTDSGKLSAQFEETLLVTDTGVEILTRRLDRSGQPYFMD